MCAVRCKMFDADKKARFGIMPNAQEIRRDISRSSRVMRKDSTMTIVMKCRAEMKKRRSK
jgi:hypothetical protein